MSSRDRPPPARRKPLGQFIGLASFEECPRVASPGRCWNRLQLTAALNPSPALNLPPALPVFEAESRHPGGVDQDARPGARVAPAARGSAADVEAAKAVEADDAALSHAVVVIAEHNAASSRPASARLIWASAEISVRSAASSITSFRRYRCGNGYSPCPNGCATSFSATQPCKARCRAFSSSSTVSAHPSTSTSSAFPSVTLPLLHHRRRLRAGRRPGRCAERQFSCHPRTRRGSVCRRAGARANPYPAHLRQSWADRQG